MEREEAFVERGSDFGSSEGSVGVEDSEEANGGFGRAVTEGVDEREEKRGEGEVGEREEELLGEGEGREAEGGARQRDRALKSVCGEV